MTILRMYGELPPDLEVELYHETSGETVKWAGRSSGVVEKFQGWALIGAGALFALVNLGGVAVALGVILDLAERAHTPDTETLIAAVTGIILFAAGAGAALIGWRFLKSADRIVWAVTDKRLLRIVAGGAQPTRSWRKPDILKLDRLNWSDAEKRCLAVTVKGRGQNNPVLMIIGPVDLEAAEEALIALEE